MASSSQNRLILLLFLLIFTTTSLLPNSITAQPYSNITHGQSLLANAANSSWPSPSADFAFGFHRVIGGYLLAIWFDKIPEKTVIWSANRDNLAPEGSSVQLARDGRLVLTDPSGQQIWSAAASTSSAMAYAAMLDNGNFMLASNTSQVLWQSFDEPTDSLVPDQMLELGGLLISSFSATNYSKGRFLFQLQTDGNLVFATRNFPMDDQIRAYLATATVGYGHEFIFNQSGYFNLIAQNGTLLSNLYSNIGASTRQFHQRLTLDYDGVLRHYVYPKSANSSGGRAMAWSVYDFLPTNVCTQIRQDTGGGACGFNSLCAMGTDDQRPRCSCPTGYSPVEPNDWKSDCKQNFPRQSCDDQDQNNDVFVLDEMPNADWPDSDYAHFSPVSEDWCRQSCLSDCSCDVAIHRGNDCWKKRMPLSNGKLDPSVGGKALIKIRSNNNNSSNTNTTMSGVRNRNRSALIITGSVLLGSSVLVNILVLSSMLLFGFHCRRRGGIKDVSTTTTSVAYPGVNVRCFSYKELDEATDGFKNEVGNGAYSRVYKGKLRDGNREEQDVAVKKLIRIASEAEQEFKAEVSSISRTNHKNLVRLLGYCDEGQNRLLVYEFMSKGSLASFLFDNEKKSRPSWYARVQIAFAAARGLCYLHEECSTQIIHCDIKPQNVLLDDHHIAKISDFGLAKLLKGDQTRTTTGIRGTRGYVAPEWFRNMPITVKVDVYSYGIMLLELVCCRRNFEPDVEDERKRILCDWAYDCCSDEALGLLVGEGDEEEVADDMKRFEKLVKIAMWCIQEDPEMRPQMKRVVHMLEGSAQVPPPPDPASAVC